MKIEKFGLERLLSQYENTVKYNLTESGIHPFTLEELLSEEEIRKLSTLRIGYAQANGTIELREAISRLYPGAGLDNILVTNGTAEANFINIWCNLAPGDELILMVPNYMQMWGIARSLGITVKPFHLREDLDWGPDLKELKSLISPQTRMIAVCNPNNPTGAVLSEESMQEIVRLAQDTDAWLYADEVYRGAELDGKETPSFYGLYDKAMVCCGLSKAYALPGLRLGWMVGPKKTIEECWAGHDYTAISSGLISDYVASLALQPERREKILSRNRRIISENLAVLQEWVTKHDKVFSFIPPRAGAIAFLKYSLNINSTELSTKLREEKSVFIAPGDCFMMDHYLRIGLGSEKEYLLAALDLFDEVLAEIS